MINKRKKAKLNLVKFLSSDNLDFPMTNDEKAHYEIMMECRRKLLSNWENRSRSLDIENMRFWRPAIDKDGKIVGHENEIPPYGFWVWTNVSKLLKLYPNCLPVPYTGSTIKDPYIVS